MSIISIIKQIIVNRRRHGRLIRYANLRVAHAPGMPGTFSSPPTSKETASLRSRHASRRVRHARAVMHVGIANPRWQRKRSRHSRRMHNPQFYVSGKRPMETVADKNDCEMTYIEGANRQRIRLHGIDLFLPEYSSPSSRRMTFLSFWFSMST